MKLTIIGLLFLVYFNVNAQITDYDSIMTDFYAYLPYIHLGETEERAEASIKIADKIKKWNFIKDTSLTYTIDSIISLLKNLSNCDTVLFTGFENKLYYQAEAYLVSLNYSSLTDTIQILDSIFKSDEGRSAFFHFNYLPYLGIQVDSNYLKSRFNIFNNNRTKQRLLSSYYSINGNSPNISYFIEPSRNNLDLYKDILLLIRMNNLDTSVTLPIEREWFINNHDMEDSLNLAFLKYKINGERTEAQKLHEETIMRRLDSFNYKWMEEYLEKTNIYIDSINHLEPIMPSDSIGLINWLISQDSTLEKISYAMNDGKRFDTISSDTLINYFLASNPKSVYDSIKTEFDLYSSKEVIYFKKIIQILGDRLSYGLFNPNPEQKQKLENIVELYGNYLMDSIPYVMQSEASFQLLRLGKSNIPIYLNWVRDSTATEHKQRFVNDHLHKFVDEETIIKIISEAALQESNGHRNGAIRFINLLGGIYFQKYLANPGLPIRRPTRTLEQSIEWSTKYVIPQYDLYGMYLPK